MEAEACHKAGIMRSGCSPNTFQMQVVHNLAGAAGEYEAAEACFTRLLNTEDLDQHLRPECVLKPSLCTILD